MIFVNAPSFTIPYLRGLVSGGCSVTTIFARPSGGANEGRLLAPPPIGILTRRGDVSICRPTSLGGDSTTRVVADVGPSVVVIITCNGVLPPSILSVPGCNYVGIRTSLLPGCENTTPVR